MQDAFDRSFMASSPKNYFPSAVGEFAKEVFSNPLLEDFRQITADQGKEALVPLVETRIVVASELEVAVLLISSYVKVIPSLSHIIEECDKIKKNRPQDNLGVFDLCEKLRKACFIISSDQHWNRHRDHSEILKKLVKLDDVNNIIKYVFAPSMHKLSRETELFERNEKASLYYSVYHLSQLNACYDLNTRPNKIQGFSDDNNHEFAEFLSLKAVGFDQALEEQKSEASASLGFDIEESKTHLHRVWKFIKPIILSQKTENINQEDSYDGATGIFIYKGKKIEFINSRLSGKILGLLHPNGKLIDYISEEDVYYGAMKDEADPEWYCLDKDDLRKIKRKIYQSCTNINTRLATDYDKENKQYFLKVKNNGIRPNCNSSK